MKRILVIFLFSTIVLCACRDEQEKTGQSANAGLQKMVSDSLWFKVYDKLNNRTISPVVRSILLNTSSKYSIDHNEVSLFNMLLWNYPCDTVRIEHFLVKYPFASKRFVEDSFNRLVQNDLLKQHGHFYSLTERGLELSNFIGSQIRSHQVNGLMPILDLLEQVPENVNRNKFNGIQKSLKLRKQATLRFAGDTSQFARLVTVMGDLVALRNDQSHYRYNFLIDTINLSFPEEEIMASAFQYGFFDEDRFDHRPTWGHTNFETQKFLKTLEDKQLLFKQDSIWNITAKGKMVEDIATKEMEFRFYYPWSLLKHDAVDQIRNYVGE